MILDYPLPFFALSFVVLALSAWIGAAFLSKQGKIDEDIRDDFATILAATLTLLGFHRLQLLDGHSRVHQRKESGGVREASCNRHLA
jgi:hypothetical protein